MAGNQERTEGPSPLEIEAFVSLVLRILDGDGDPAHLDQVRDALVLHARYAEAYVSVCGQVGMLSDAMQTKESQFEESLNLLDLEDPDAANAVAGPVIIDERVSPAAVLSQATSREVSPSTRRVIIIPRLIAYGAFAAILALSSVIIYSFIQAGDAGTSPSTATRNEALGPESPPRESGAVAFIASESVAAKWTDAHEDNPTDLYADRSYELSAGSVTVEYLAGVRMEIAAPAQFSIVHSQCVEISLGTAEFNVPTSGQGFTALFPGGIVIDKGTAFQIKVPLQEAVSRVEVTQGLVLIGSRENGKYGDPRELREGEFAEVEHTGLDLQRFTWTGARVEIPTNKTGAGEKKTGVDPHWTVRIPSGNEERAAHIVSPLNVDRSGKNLKWMPATSESRWIALNPYASPVPTGVYAYVTRLQVPRGFVEEDLVWNMRFIADDEIIGVKVNGEVVPAKSLSVTRNLMNSGDFNQMAWEYLEVRDVFKCGDNTVEFLTQNQYGAAGFRAEATVVGYQAYRPLD